MYLQDLHGDLQAQLECTEVDAVLQAAVPTDLLTVAMHLQASLKTQTATLDWTRKSPQRIRLDQKFKLLGQSRLTMEVDIITVSVRSVMESRKSASRKHP